MGCMIALFIVISIALAALVTVAAWPLESNKQSKTREVRRRPF
jgi:flagellar basal body-associated protein FliL